jgi:hypothetical protein
MREKHGDTACGLILGACYLGISGLFIDEVLAPGPSDLRVLAGAIATLSLFTGLFLIGRAAWLYVRGRGV